MKKLILLGLALLCAIPELHAQIVSSDPQTRYHDSDCTLVTDCNWRWRFNGTGSSSTATLEYSTSGQFAAVTTTVSITSAGVVTFSGPPIVTGMTQGSIVFAGASGLLSQSNSYFYWDDTNKRLGIGTIAPAAKLSVSTNAATLQAPSGIGTTLAQFAAADAANTRVLIDTNGGAAFLDFRAANGTAITPSALTNNYSLGQIGWMGYGATSYNTTPRATIKAQAAENWTDTAQGTYIAFATTPKLSTTIAERMRIDDAGNVGIGTTAPLALLHIASDSVAEFIVAQYSSDTSPAVIANFKARGTQASPLAVQSGDQLMRLVAGGHDGTQFRNAANIYFEADAAPSGGQLAGRIIFNTNNGTSQAERMRITSTGAIRLANLGIIYSRNAANSGDYALAGLDASNNTFFGDATTPIYLRGTAVSFFGATAAARTGAYTVSNSTPTRTLDVSGVTAAQVANALAQVIADLKTYGLFQ